MRKRHPIPASDELALTFDVVLKLAFATDPDGGYVVTSPDLPGFEAWGMDVDVARHTARMNIIQYLDEREEAGEAIPLLRYTESGKWRRADRAKNRPPEAV